jgi:hypothetical protein
MKRDSLISRYVKFPDTRSRTRRNYASLFQTPQDLLQEDPRKASGPSITARARSAFE